MQQPQAYFSNKVNEKLALFNNSYAIVFVYGWSVLELHVRFGLLIIYVFLSNGIFCSRYLINFGLQK